MAIFLLFIALGLSQGAVYALIGQGLVLVYRSSGVLNFAQGAFGMVAAYAFYELRVQHGWAAAPALLAGVALAAVLGLITQLVIMRRLRNSAPLTRMISTLGLFLFLSEAVVLRYQGHALSSPSVLPTRRIDVVGSLSIGLDEIILILLAVAVTVALHVVYRNTRFGMATTATAENEAALSSLGWSPNFISAVNWSVGGGLAGLAAILVTSDTGLSTDIGLLIIPAVAAALIGRFQSFWWTLAAGLGIGVIQAELGRYISAPGWTQAIPFLFIIAFLIVRGRALPLRGEGVTQLPRIGAGQRKLLPLVATAAATAVLLAWVLTPGWVYAVTVTLLFAIVLLSVVVVTGMAGQLSLVQYTLSGLAALVATRIAVTHGLGFLPALLAGLVAIVPIAALVGLPALRLRGVNLAVVTLALGYVAQELIFGNYRLTGGYSGTQLPSPSLLGVSVDNILHPRRYALVVLIAVSVCALVVRNIRWGRTGRRLLAVRANERAAAALGISVTGAKLYAFTVAGVIAGLGGILTAYSGPFVVFKQFDVISNVSAVALAVIGGIGYISGAMVGGSATPGGVIPQVLQSSGNVQQWIALFGGLAVVLTVMVHADGLAPAVAHRMARLGRLLRPLIPHVAGAGRRWSAKSQIPHAVAPAPVLRVRPGNLSIDNVTVRYGTVTAVSAVSLSVEPGQVVGLVGPNGAGKTSLIDAVTGFTPASSGLIKLGDVVVTGWGPGKLARHGLGRCFQSLELFEDMTVEENLLAAGDDRNPSSYLTDLIRPGTRRLTPAAAAAVEEFGLASELSSLPGELPAGRRRLVGLARAVAARPSVLLLDEPAAGLDSAETAAIGNLIRGLASTWGMAVLLVEHDIDLVFRICDRVVVLNFGEAIADGPSSAVRSAPAVIEAYLGTPRGSLRRPEHAAKPAPESRLT